MIDDVCYLSGDEDCGVSLMCRLCDRGGLPIGYYAGFSAGNPYKEAEVPTLPRIGSLVRAAVDHAVDVHDWKPRLQDASYEEWRVTGDPGQGYPPYEFTWSPRRNSNLGDPEIGARNFVAMIEEHGGWPDGPHLSRRTVTLTEWKSVAA